MNKTPWPGVAAMVIALCLAGCAGSPTTPDPISGSAFRSLVRSDFPVFDGATDAQLTRLGKTGCAAMTATDLGITSQRAALERNLGLSAEKATTLMNYQASAYCPEVLAQLGDE